MAPVTAAPTTSPPTTPAPTEEVVHVRGESYSADDDEPVDGPPVDAPPEPTDVDLDRDESDIWNLIDRDESDSDEIDEDAQSIEDEDWWMFSSTDDASPAEPNPEPPLPTEPRRPNVEPNTDGTASLTVACDTEGATYVSRDQGDTWSPLDTVDSTDGSMTIDDVDMDTIVRHMCASGFYASMEFADERYDSFYWTSDASGAFFEFNFAQILEEDDAEPEEVIQFADGDAQGHFDHVADGNEPVDSGVPAAGVEQQILENHDVTDPPPPPPPGPEPTAPQDPQPSNSLDVEQWTDDEVEVAPMAPLEPRPKERRNTNKRQLKRRSRSKSKLLRPFRELKVVDPFSRRLVEDEDTEIDAVYLQSLQSGHHKVKRQRRTVPDLRDELTTDGVPDYAQTGFQGVDVSALEMDLLRTDANDKTPYDKYGLSAPALDKPDAKSDAPPKPKPDDKPAPKPKPEPKPEPKPVAEDKPAPPAQSKPKPAADPKAAVPAQSQPAPPKAENMKPGDAKPESAPKPKPKDKPADKPADKPVDKPADKPNLDDA